ncbi:hypothetical protein M434DRAFT_402632 [Hypoxylon sp. CO27-5]|nr:hypothetical protein M434DRAFT_402632 [Hypoxylon sp. CO27-5]
MLEFFTYKKVKKHREEKAEKQRLEKEKEKGKGKEIDGSAKNTPAVTLSELSSSPEIVLEKAEGMPILDQEDEKFLERLTSPSDSHIGGGDDDDDETPPPLPPRVKTPVIELEDSDVSSYENGDNKGEAATAPSNGNDGKRKDKDGDEEKDKPDHKPKRFALITNLSRNISLKRKPDAKQQHHQEHKHKHSRHLTVPPSSSTTTTTTTTAAAAAAPDADLSREALKEETDMARVLEDLNLAASTDNKAFSLSRESAETLRKFTQVLKDLVNGVPTAYGDLISLIEDRDGVLARSYEKLPRSLKKLVAQLPDKLTSSLAPELLAAAAEAQGLKVEGGEEDGGKDGGVGKKFLSPGNLMELVTKPGAVVGLLKGIVNALKTRWPAFVGTNVLWSVAVFLLLSALWYCYKRGRETRLEKEAAEAAGTTPNEDGTVKAIEGAEGSGADGSATPAGETPDEPSQQQRKQPSISVSAPAASTEGTK